VQVNETGCQKLRPAVNDLSDHFTLCNPSDLRDHSIFHQHIGPLGPECCRVNHPPTGKQNPRGLKTVTPRLCLAHLTASL